MISCEVRVSRLPVGSSARSRLGALIKARAMATRCCWPPESWPGVLCSRSPRPRSCSAARARSNAHGAVASARGGVIERQADILDGAGAGQKVEALEDEAEPLAADAGEVRLAQPRDIDALEEIVAAGRPVEAAENGHQRRFARARRAHDGDELAALDRQADAAQRFDLDVADDEGAGDILDLDDRLRGSDASRVIAAPSQRRGGGRPDWPLA